MKVMKKGLAMLLALVLLSMTLAACGSDTTQSVDVSLESADTDGNSSALASEETSTEESTPRNETLYLAGMFWSKPNDFNPMSVNSNFNLIAQNAGSPEILYETLFMYNSMTNELVPLLAKDYIWNDDHTAMTVTLNPDAKWNDGTPVTAEDVAYTWTVHQKYATNEFSYFKEFVEAVVALDETTVEIQAKLRDDGNAQNPLLLEEYLPRVYVMQKAYLEKVEERNNGDPEKIKTDVMEDTVTSAPYSVTFYSDQKLIATRNENYWGQADSMWGKLPTPKYIACIAYKDNAAVQVALEAGEVDIADLYVPNVWNLWEEKGLPITTYITEEPYNISACMPTLFFNLERPGLDNVSVRRAIAMAIDYDQIRSNAMTNQSPSFQEYPHSLMNPTEGEQAMIDQDALKDVQIEGNDVAGANALLDEAGILDTDGDGIRELNGQKLSFKIQCPSGWSDWSAAVEIVASAGKSIGIEMETYYPEKSVHINDYATGNFDMAMANSPGGSISSPWNRAYMLMSSSTNDMEINTVGNFGKYENAEVDELLSKIPQEQDEEKLREMYTRLSYIYLEDMPSVALMYRPNSWMVMNESVWTGYPLEGDGTNIPPELCTKGYSVAGLYQLRNVE
jgi:peptide/nickel transport system substrate-binding protein